MNETDIRKYARLMKELDLSGLEITEDKRKIRLERTLSMPAQESPYAIPLVAGDMGEDEHSVDGAKASKDRDYISVHSPVVGVFYAAPADNASPFVSVGDKVSRGQTLCIVEAMKLMNEITAEDDGVISEVCVRNGQVVEYGTELFHIKK